LASIALTLSLSFDSKKTPPLAQWFPGDLLF
jgi:hypothetical protein